jgi:hypothetical protein
MQRLLPTNSPRHFLLPLPPGVEQTSLDLLGFFVYEFRVGHFLGWSTARARFGPPLRVTGVQHPAPPLSCEAFRTVSGIVASAPYATPVYDGGSLLPTTPATNIWVLLYAQVTQADGEDHRNILLSRRPAPFRRKHDHAASGAAGDALVGPKSKRAPVLGLPKSSPLSVLAVELPLEVNRAPDPLGSDRHDQDSALIAAGTVPVRPATLSAVTCSTPASRPFARARRTVGRTFGSWLAIRHQALLNVVGASRDLPPDTRNWPEASALLGTACARAWPHRYGRDRRCRSR